MKRETEKISKVFAKNRAEELGADVWNEFVVPLFFNELDLLSARKPRIIIGGRGCGKTMLLRYLSHESQFSRKRLDVDDDSLRDIGLYWRIDTQFANVMCGRGIEKDIWISAFDHFFSLYVSLEILNAIRSIQNSQLPIEIRNEIANMSLDELEGFDTALCGTTSILAKALEKRLSEFELWVSNLGKVSEPVFFPGVTFVNALIEGLRRNSRFLAETVFHIFLDEFENLLEYQQRIVNTRIKHSNSPLIVSVAMKRRGFATRQTLGNESISDIADFRKIDLEELLIGSEGKDFELFAAEVFLLNLSLAQVDELPVDVSCMRDVDELQSRRAPEYRKEVLKFVEGVFPGRTHLELAEEVLKTPWLEKRLRRQIEIALSLRGATQNPDDFIRSDFPMESIVCFALLNRRNITPDEILASWPSLKDRDTKFSNWVHNNLVGCILWLYDAHQRVCPIFAGFSVFTKLSKGNLRHFLELCYKSVASHTSESPLSTFEVSVETQAKAARQTSTAFLGEIRSCGPLGNRLHSFVLKLGSLFSIAHLRTSQSEPEQNHFSIKGGENSLTPESMKLLEEAIKWSILFEIEETKIKQAADRQISNYEYVLNPVYAPYFNISYRKKRKLELAPEQFVVLTSGTYEEVSDLLKAFSKKWTVNLEDADQTLFSHLLD